MSFASDSDDSSSSSDSESSSVGSSDSHKPHQQLPVKCTYHDCQHRFRTLKEMQKHKKHDPNHFYCKECDLDCIDWDDFIHHKVTMMAPYLDDAMNEAQDGPPKHITCEFCGEDFGSFGGRKRHRAQMHRAPQSMTCKGCHEHFELAAALVHHLETGRCPAISKRDFKGSAEQKTTGREIMKDIDGVTSKLAQNKLLMEPLEPDGDDAGGVSLSLFDQPNEAKQSGYRILQPKVEHLSNELYFRSANHAPKAGDWGGFLTKMREEAAADDHTNIVKSRWWDPDSADYNVGRFYNQSSRTYVCPLPDCGGEYLAAGDMDRHMQEDHKKTARTCPLCRKRFESAHALLAHAEMTSKCNIRQSVHFEKIVDEVSGGFIRAQTLAEPKVYRRDEQSLIKAGEQPTHGVMNTRYSAKLPHEK